MELREEQLLNVTWSGDPNKPMVVDSSLELSTRRSFAAWSELVRGTARPWNPTELALARAIGRALVDIIVQVHGVRLLIGEQQLRRTRATIAGARQPVLVGQADGRPLLAHAAFVQLAGAARDGRPLALVLTEHREAERAGAARARLAQAIACASVARADLRRDEGDDPLMRAILTRARLAAMDIAEPSDDAPMAPVLAEVTAATRRAARLLGWMRSASD